MAHEGFGLVLAHDLGELPLEVADDRLVHLLRFLDLAAKDMMRPEALDALVAHRRRALEERLALERVQDEWDDVHLRALLPRQVRVALDDRVGPQLGYSSAAW